MMFHRHSELEATLSELEVYYKHREFKSDATIQQQTKLIDYLQKRIDEGDRRKKVCVNTNEFFVLNILYPCFLINVLDPVLHWQIGVY
jgi:hypothetical protein